MNTSSFLNGDVTCVRCIMNSAVDSTISLDHKGVCNHCQRYDEILGRRTLKGNEGVRKLEGLIARNKSSGSKKTYDCVIGLSGGVDSTYVAYMCKKYELRPLAVHFDNGWNTCEAEQNIKNAVQKL